MRCSHCGICCTETEMLLSKKDIERIEKLGFQKRNFVKYDKQGFAQLRNHDSYCVFYNRKSQRCGIYENRPIGCRVYPVILDESIGIVLDDICPDKGTISDAEMNLKGKRVINLLKVIDNEAAIRQRNNRS